MKIAAALTLAAALPGTAWAAAPLTAEGAIEAQRRGIQEAVGTAPCSREGAGEDIVICGRRGPDPNRLPFPDARVEGEREHLLPGELPRATASLDTCVAACPQPVQVNLLKAISKAPLVVRHILGKE